MAKSAAPNDHSREQQQNALLNRFNQLLFQQQQQIQRFDWTTGINTQVTPLGGAVADMPYKFKIGDRVRYKDVPHVAESWRGIKGVIYKVENNGYGTVSYFVDLDGPKRPPNCHRRNDALSGFAAIDEARQLELDPDPPNPPLIVDFDSVILADEKKQQILDAIKQMDNQDLIFETWGFGQVFEKGTAISLLFYGEPGTGKTLMAQAIADRFKYKLQRIGTAEIESSEPGGAERAIKAFFEHADGKTILLFDECDSLLYNRQDVGSILGAQVNQLLQSLEMFKGIVVFTTNRLGVLDEALNRRLSLKLEFSLPNADERVEIWKRMFPKKAPLAKDVQWEKLAGIEITGGYIKNVVLRAARMAANEDKPDKEKEITYRHLVEALKHEVTSMSDFEDANDRQPHVPRPRGPGLGITRTIERTLDITKGGI